MVDFARFFQSLGSGGNLRGSDIENNSISTNDVGSDANLDSSFTDMSSSHGNLRGTSFIDSNKASFIYSIISKWYLLVSVPAMTVTYNVVKALEDQGILAMMYADVDKALKMLVKVSMDCPQLITDTEKFMRCLGW